MKKIIAFLITSILAIGAFAQGTPQAFNYQGAARYANGEPISSTEIGILIQIEDERGGEVYYTEEHITRTNDNGMFTIAVGKGKTEDQFENIPWGGNKDLYMFVAMDPRANGDWVKMGKTQLLSLPYALHAKQAETVLENPSLWKEHENGIHYDEGNVGIGTTNPPASAALTVKSSTQGFLPPRMTTAERDAIADPEEGLMVWNIETKSINVYGGTDWCEVYTTCNPPANPNESIWFKTDQSTFEDFNIALWGNQGSQITIDWGDGSPLENITLNESFQTFDHNYSEHSIFNINVLGDVGQIKKIEIDTSHLVEVNISKAINLESFGIEEGMVSELDLSNNNLLVYLGIWDNPIADIDLSNLTDLEILNIKNCSFNLLNSESNINLKEFTAWNCNLTSVNFHNNLLLESIFIPENNLTSIDCSNLTYLQMINFQDNYVTNTNFNGCNEIFNIVCSNNALNSIDITGLNKLFQLYAMNNQISSFEFDFTNYEQGLPLYLNLNYNEMTAQEIHNIVVNLRDQILINNFTGAMWVTGNENMLPETRTIIITELLPAGFGVYQAP